MAQAFKPLTSLPSLCWICELLFLSIQIAKVEKLKPLEVELRRLEDLSESIVNDFAYMKKREEEMRDTNGNKTMQFMKLELSKYLQIFLACVFSFLKSGRHLRLGQMFILFCLPTATCTFLPYWWLLFDVQFMRGHIAYIFFLDIFLWRWFLACQSLWLTVLQFENAFPIFLVFNMQLKSWISSSEI